jgi:hypothetical protein
MQGSRRTVALRIGSVLLWSTPACDSHHAESSDPSKTHAILSAAASAGTRPQLSARERAQAEALGPLRHAPPAAPLADLTKPWAFPERWSAVHAAANRTCREAPHGNFVVTCNACDGYNIFQTGDKLSSRAAFYDAGTGKLVGVCICGDVQLPGGNCREYGVHPRFKTNSCARTQLCPAEPSAFGACPGWRESDGGPG